MRNIDVRTVNHSRVPLSDGTELVPKCSSLSFLGGLPCLYTLTTSSTRRSLTLHCTLFDNVKHERDADSSQLPWSECDLSQYVASTKDVPVALVADPGGFEDIVVATRKGLIISIQADRPVSELVGAVVDEDENSSGILTLGRSPDGALLTVVSPVKVSIMSVSWELLREIDLKVIAVDASVSWRGDGDVFVVTLRDVNGIIHGRVIDREFETIVDVNIAGLGLGATESALGTAVAWEPRVGGAICLAGPGSSVSFFERNGLHHLRNDFTLRDKSGLPAKSWVGREVPDFVGWSCDSSMLAVAVPRNSANTFSRPCAVEIFMRSNYLWFLKAFMPVPTGVVDLRWDTENSRTLHILSSCGKLQSYSLSSSYDRSIFQVNGTTMVSVVDGAILRLTNFSKAIIPPPMVHSCFEASAPIYSVCFNEEGSGKIGMLLANGVFEICPLDSWRRSSAVDRSGNSVVAQLLDDDLCKSSWCLRSNVLSDSLQGPWRLPVFVSDDVIALVEPATFSGQSESICLWNLAEGRNLAEKLASLSLDGLVMAISKSKKIPSLGGNGLVVATSCGRIVLLGISEDLQCNPSPYKLFVSSSIPCSSAADAVNMVDVVIGSSERHLVFARDTSGVLEVVDTALVRSLVICRDCSSFCISNDFLIYTTRSHLMHCLPIDSPKRGAPIQFSLERTIAGLLNSASSDLADKKDGLDGAQVASLVAQKEAGLIRPIDRGSCIVGALVNDVRIVLQAPRGNLETIAPRPLVNSRVVELARRKEYGSAFVLSRQQRIDMNVLVDADPDGFCCNIASFVRQVDDPSHLCIFITFLKGPEASVSSICRAMVDVIDQFEDPAVITRYTTTVITAIYRCQPTDFPSLLKRIRAVYKRSAAEGANALDFLHVLVKDEELLYRKALGTYNLTMAYMVAKASHMDPAEYSIELNSLQRMDECHRRYSIDMKLEAYESALGNLFLCGEKERTACLDLTRKHALFETALRLFAKDSAGLGQVRKDFSSFLIAEERFSDAAAVCASNSDWELAAMAHRDAGEWQLALSAFQRVPQDNRPTNARFRNVATFAETVAASLTETSRHVEAARVRSIYLEDADGALNELIAAHEWEAALELVSGTYFRPASLPMLGQTANEAYVHVRNELVSAAESSVKDLHDTAFKLQERTARLIAIRETKARMKATFGSPGGNGGESDSDALSSSTGASSLGSSVASDVTFATSTSAMSSRTSLYASVGRGNSSRGRASTARRAGKASRKRIRPGDAREEDALLSTILKLVPNDFARQRTSRALRALAHVQESKTALVLQDALARVIEHCHSLPQDLLGREEVQSAIGDVSCELKVIRALGEP
jgi:elongator complex protein 1